MKITEQLENLPIHVFEWCEYKGEIYFAQPNYEKSEKCHRPIIDLHFCATAWQCGLVLKSVNYEPDLFKPWEVN